VFEKVYAKILSGVEAAPAVKQRIFRWALGVGREVSRLEREGKPLRAGLRVRRALADRLVFSKLRAALGGRLRFCVSGSAPLALEIAEFFHAAGILILEGYGLTETCPILASNHPDAFKFGTVGQPFPGIEVKIAEDGEILARGPNIAKGYYRKQEETAAVFEPGGWFRTGDIGEFDRDGFLRITDRKKDLIKTSGGKYVAPQKIEVIFSAECPWAGHIVVHGDGRNFASALITLDDEMIQEWAAKNDLTGRTTAELAKEPKVHELIDEHVQKLNGQLERWETIKKFIILPRDLTVEDGELTPSMKVRRKIVEQKYMSELDSLYR
jgi:long-chain acyl-CoA synthetase